ncbi:GNAT family N-acetyltransferase [Streptomyces lavendulae]|uniref:GNAT family N-acetyltransferase n=1 Tax=Streptomyces lavendulae TaxID=1914 RepID=UPI0036AC0E3B
MIKPLTPPPGMNVRPVTLEDSDAVCTLLNDIDLLEIGRANTTPTKVLAAWKHPELDLECDSWLLHGSGQLLAYGVLWDRSGHERIDIGYYTLPGHPHGETHLFDLMEARAVERAALNGATRVVMHMHLNIRPTADTRALRRRGWRPVRRYNVLTRPLSPATESVPSPPPGVSIRPCWAQEDRRRAHALLQTSFADHFDFQPRTYEQWLDDIGADRTDWSLIWITQVDGLGDAAAILTHNNRDSGGWISALGVLREARGRGLGSYLLRHAFGHYATLGRDRIGLGVDTDNGTGALALYEGHGMTLDFAVETWELTRPVPA